MPANIEELKDALDKLKLTGVVRQPPQQQQMHTIFKSRCSFVESICWHRPKPNFKKMKQTITAFNTWDGRSWLST